MSRIEQKLSEWTELNLERSRVEQLARTDPEYWTELVRTKPSPAVLKKVYQGVELKIAELSGITNKKYTCSTDRLGDNCDGLGHFGDLCECLDDCGALQHPASDVQSGVSVLKYNSIQYFS